MNTKDAFELNRDSLVRALEGARTVREGQTAVSMAFERIAAELAQNETDEATRQRTQAVLALAKQTPAFLSGVEGEGRLVAQNTAPSENKVDKAKIGQMAGIGILAMLSIFEIIDGRWGFAFLAVIGILLIVLGKSMKQEENKVNWQAEAILTLDRQQIVRTVEEICRSIDIAVSDLSMIDQEHKVRQSGAQEDALLDLMSALMEAKESGRDDLALASLDEAEQTLRRLGITALRYEPANADFFDLLPTQGKSRTIRPALMNGDQLLRRGVAAVQEQGVAR